MWIKDLIFDKAYWLYIKIKNIENLYLKLALGLCVFLFYTLISSNLHISSQLPLAYSMLACMYLYGKFVKKQDQLVRTILVFFGLYLSLRYMHWRFTVSICYPGFFDFIGTMLLVMAEIYSINIYVLGIFSSIMPLQRKVIDVSDWEDDQLPTVDIYVPTYDEPVEMVVNTCLAASDIDYPKDRFNVFICDDGGTDQKCNDSNPVKAKAAQERRRIFKEVSAKGGFGYLTRPRNEHAKAGNINTAMQNTSGELVLILDCDHIPTASFLRNTVGWFREEPKMFLVQTPHCFYNADPVERNLQFFRDIPSENQMFYQHIQKGHDFWESSFFCGSAAVLRRKYLEEVGGIAGETITEDAETAVGLHAKGYKSAFIAIPMVRGRNPDTFAGLVLQRIRWTQGMIQIFVLKNPFKMKGLRWFQRFSYTSASSFWFFAFSRTTFLISPLLYLFFGLKIYRADSMDLLAFTIPHVLAANNVSSLLYSKVRWSLFSEVYETAVSIFTLPAIIEVLIRPRGLQFEVTPKGEDITKDFVSHLVYPFVVLLLLIIAGFIAAGYRWVVYPQEHHIILMTSAWNVFNFFLITTGLGISSEKGELRTYERMPSNEQCSVKVGNLKLNGRIRDISEGGVAVELIQRPSQEKMIEIVRREQGEITIQDEKGRRIPLNVKILRIRNTRLITRFIGLDEDLEARRRLLSVIYGDETRWIRMDERDSSPPFFSVLWLIMKHSYKNTNYTAIRKACVQALLEKLRLVKSTS
ncbi:MAG: UDP-forming cellulose synthase catalytic subunit [Desulfobulbaceae bacterium]|nr:UDP-forming cellulose synthase catalytic subunit [Desulfobulbaceae bacterium]